MISETWVGSRIPNIDVVEEAIEQGFSVKEIFRDVRGDIELSCFEEVEEYYETIWVPINEVITIIISNIVMGLEIPIVVEHGYEEGITATVGKGGGPSTSIQRKFDPENLSGYITEKISSENFSGFNPEKFSSPPQRNLLKPRENPFHVLNCLHFWTEYLGVTAPQKKVYEKEAKDVALSVVSGINCINFSYCFGYGQTSSGKTFTMTGITEYAIADIYDYIEKHNEREFLLKFSAMEIYNESVRDLLSTDSSPLRLLDDPKRGTVTEKLTEEPLRDWNNVMELLSICEAQRQIGETALNETSSKSHQIIRLVGMYK
ncbi:unnamed protein product [Camellia sinensis]